VAMVMSGKGTVTTVTRSFISNGSWTGLSTGFEVAGNNLKVAGE